MSNFPLLVLIMKPLAVTSLSRRSQDFCHGVFAGFGHQSTSGGKKEKGQKEKGPGSL
ncbi:MAG: hypothetical protein M1547_06210 [Gammaproteobacteria bacterium]|nr:hypothetical protein [Gammaproteobacteria bacterium]